MLLTKHKPTRMLFGLLETLNFLQVKLWLKNRGRAGRFCGIMFRNYMSLAKGGPWRSLTIEELFPQMTQGRIVLEPMPGCGIWTPIDELAYLALITRNLQPRNIFEIGTYRGRTALNFALNSPPECQIHTLDLPMDLRAKMQSITNAADASIIQHSHTGVDYQGKPGSEKIHQLFGDSTRFDFSPYYGRMDLVFVDGAHHYDAVASDTRQALEMVPPGGWIVWHDFANYGDYHDVTRAVLDLLPPGDVIQIDNTQLAAYRKPDRSRLPT